MYGSRYFHSNHGTTTTCHPWSSNTAFLNRVLPFGLHITAKSAMYALSQHHCLTRQRNTYATRAQALPKVRWSECGIFKSGPHAKTLPNSVWSFVQLVTLVQKMVFAICFNGNLARHLGLRQQSNVNGVQPVFRVMAGNNFIAVSTTL